MSTRARRRLDTGGKHVSPVVFTAPPRNGFLVFLSALLVESVCYIAQVGLNSCFFSTLSGEVTGTQLRQDSFRVSWARQGCVHVCMYVYVSVCWDLTLKEMIKVKSDQIQV